VKESTSSQLDFSTNTSSPVTPSALKQRLSLSAESSSQSLADQSPFSKRVSITLMPKTEEHEDIELLPPPARAGVARNSVVISLNTPILNLDPPTKSDDISIEQSSIPLHTIPTSLPISAAVTSTIPSCTTPATTAAFTPSPPITSVVSIPTVPANIPSLTLQFGRSACMILYPI